MSEKIDNGFNAWWEKSSIMDIGHRNGETHPQREKRIAELAWKKALESSENRNNAALQRSAFEQMAAQRNCNPMYSIGLKNAMAYQGMYSYGCALGGMLGVTNQQKQSRKPSLLVRYHRWQSDRLSTKLRVSKLACQLLRISGRKYNNSHYVGILCDAEIKRVKIESKLEYHKARSEVTP